MTRYRRLAAALALVAPMLVVAACGSGPSEQVVKTDDLVPAAAVKAAAQRSLAASSQRLSMEVTLDGEVLTTLEGAGAADGSVFRGSMEMPEMGEVEYLIVDRTMYYGFPDLPNGATWVAMSFDDMAEVGVDLDAASQQQGNQALSLLAEAGSKVERVGEDELDGVLTTHYRAVVDLGKVMDRNDVLSDELGEQVLALLGDSTTMDIWIDGDGYTRRIEYGADLSKLDDPVPGLPGKGELHYTIELSEFGEPVDVQAPPDSEVIPMEEFQQSIVDGSSGLGEFTPVGDHL